MFRGPGELRPTVENNIITLFWQKLNAKYSIGQLSALGLHCTSIIGSPNYPLFSVTENSARIEFQAKITPFM